jgi:hypothetical protein
MNHAVPVEVPTWISQIMHEIDTLAFGEGFARMSAATDMYFGSTHVRGVDAIQAFFVKIDAPLNITHAVLECWQAEQTILLRGQATMAKKSDPDRQVSAPFIHIYYLSGDRTAQIDTIRITAGPLQTDSVM